MPRGSTEVLIEGETLLVQWKDNSVVTMATNAIERYSEVQASRWSKKKKPVSKRHSLCISKTKTRTAWICMIFMSQDIDLQ